MRSSAGRDSDELRELWEEMTMVRRSVPGATWSSEAAVWDALAEIPDPEIPVVSLVELGVVRDVAVEGDAFASSSLRRSSAARRSRSCATRWPTRCGSSAASPTCR